MYYIQESDKLKKINKIFRKIEIKNNTISLPINQNTKLESKRLKTIAEKTIKVLKKTNCNKIVLSKKIKNLTDYVNCLYSSNFEIVDGKWLYELLETDILKYIFENKKIKKQETQISILVNYATEITLKNIKEIVKQYKKVNIVTNNAVQFEKLENDILEEFGIMLVLTNNKRKSLTKSKVIINIDFPNEIINSYNIYEEAIIVNIPNNIKIFKKRFNGININDYEILMKNNEEFSNIQINKFYIKDIYEANIPKNQPIQYYKERLEKDNIKISNLLANNTIL